MGRRTTALLRRSPVDSLAVALCIYCRQRAGVQLPPQCIPLVGHPRRAGDQPRALVTFAVQSCNCRRAPTRDGRPSLRPRELAARSLSDRMPEMRLCWLAYSKRRRCRCRAAALMPRAGRQRRRMRTWAFSSTRGFGAHVYAFEKMKERYPNLGRPKIAKIVTFERGLARLKRVRS